MGYFLEVVNRLSEWGVPLRVTIRAVSSAADVISGLLVFEILRRRGSLLRATIAGVAVGASPVLFLISGYHGNTDPLFVMLVLLGSFLIIDKRMALLGGVALGLAIGIKLVPIVVLPTIAVYLVRHRRDLLVRAAAGFGVTFAVTWGPAILTQWDGLKRNVLGYAGIDDRPWGLVRFADGLGWSWWSHSMIGPGKFIVVLLCALIPAALTWRWHRLAMESVAVSLVAFLVLSPAFGSSTWFGRLRRLICSTSGQRPSTTSSEAFSCIGFMTTGTAAYPGSKWPRDSTSRRMSSSWPRCYGPC